VRRNNGLIQGFRRKYVRPDGGPSLRSPPVPGRSDGEESDRPPGTSPNDVETMAMRFAIAVLLSGLVLESWGTVFGILLPFREKFIMERLPDEDAVVRLLTSQHLESGSYFYPFADVTLLTKSRDDPAWKVLDEKHRKGPLVRVIYNKQGSPAFDPTNFLIGFIQYAISAMLLGCLLLLALPALPTYGKRVGFASLAGVFAAVAVQLSNPAWLHHPWEAELILAGSIVVGWVLSGMVLGWLIRPRSA
jgi:hypothetical protein